MVVIQELLDELRAHTLPVGHYVITASGPLGVRGIREISDIDITVDDWLWGELAAAYSADPGERSFHISPNVEVCGVDKFASLEGLPTIAEQIATADTIDGLPFLRLEYLLQLKVARAWQRDLRDVHLIRGWLGERQQYD